MEQKNQIAVFQGPPELRLPTIQHYRLRMKAEIEGFDDTDFKTLSCHLTGKVMKDRLQEFKQLIPAMLARMGIITGIEIPANENVFRLLVSEISNTIINEKRYSELTFEEYIQAFNMVANNDFGDMKDWGKSLNMKYFRQMMNAYLLYKGALMVKYLDWESIETARQKSGYDSKEFKIDYRPITERCFQEFLSGNYNPALWHYQCYDDLVTAGWVPADTYRGFEKKAKQQLIGDLNREITDREKQIDKQDMYQRNFKRSAGRIDTMPAQVGKHIQSTTELNMIHSGESEKLISTRAKQLCMEDYFKQQAMIGTEKLFEPDTIK